MSGHEILDANLYINLQQLKIFLDENIYMIMYINLREYLICMGKEPKQKKQKLLYQK